MKFYFSDKNAFEAEVICSVLESENIRYNFVDYKDSSYTTTFMPTVFMISEPKFSIVIDTSLEHWDFLQFLIKKKFKQIKKQQKQINKLEKCLSLEQKPIKNEKIKASKVRGACRV